LCGGCSEPAARLVWFPPRHLPSREGNRRGLWTIRHDAVETMLAYVSSFGVWGGSAMSSHGEQATGLGQLPFDRVRRAHGELTSLVVPGHQGMGRHLFLDVAVTDAASGGALDARDPLLRLHVGLRQHAAPCRRRRSMGRWQPECLRISVPGGDGAIRHDVRRARRPDQDVVWGW
jgi:hypothetical protein